MGSTFRIAGVIWSIKVLRLAECGYPFRRTFPALASWHARVSVRPGFRDGVMGRHRTMSAAFRVKVTIENTLGIGLAREARRRSDVNAPAQP